MYGTTALLLLLGCGLSLDGTNAQKIVRKPVLRVTSILTSPFLTFLQGNATVGGAIYEGFIDDLLEAISKRINVDFSISMVKDNLYGYKAEDGNWTGMIGELVRREADLIAAPLTVTVARAEVVDFTMPYMEAPLTILLKAPERSWYDVEQVFVILYPFRAEVWIIIAILFVVISLFMYCIWRFNPEETRRGDSGLHLKNSFFFTFSTLMWQGYHVSPRSIAGRTLACFWWSFTLFTLVAYTANLVSYFLSGELVKMDLPVQSFEDLSKNADMKIGMLHSGSTMRYFQTSKGTMEQRIWQNVQTHPDMLVRDYAEGMERVKESNGDYAYIVEEWSGKYATVQNCELRAVGDLETGRSYAFATPKNSKYRTVINMALMQLVEQGAIKRLREKWFSGPCEREDPSSFFSLQPDIGKPVSLRRFAAPLILLLIGLVITVIILVIEILCCRKKEKMIVKQPEPVEMAP